MSEFTFKAIRKRDTANAVMFQEVDANGNELRNSEALVGSIYVRKSSLNGGNPQSIEVTVKF